MKKKVAIIGNNSGGMYDFRHELIGELIRRGCAVTVLTPFDDKVDELRALGAELIETPLNRRGINPAEDIGLFARYRKLLKMLQPELVITYTIKPNVYGGLAARMAGIPYAVNITGLGTAFQKQGLLRRLVTQMYRTGCKKAKVVFFENAENRQIFLDEKIIRPQQAHLLHGAGVNLEHFQVQNYPEDDGTTRFLFVGRVMREKGIDELFAAMEKLTAEGLPCSLDVLGGYEEDYKAAIEHHEAEGWLRYHGYQPDVRPFIARSHCFVLPSWHEGMANTNLECAASGRPVITSRIHGCLEAVEDGVTGFLCAKQNADDLYRVMKQFACLPREQRKAMGLAGRRRMEKVFDKKNVVEETVRQLLREETLC